MKNGFTLVELMVVALLTSVVMSAIFMVMSSGRSTWFETDAQVSVQQELRKAMQTMKFDLAMSGPKKISCADNGVAVTSISFSVSNGSGTWTGPVNYSVSSGHLLRVNGTDTRYLANNVSALTFMRSAASPRMLQINMTVSKLTMANRNINVTQRAGVYLRN